MKFVACCHLGYIFQLIKTISFSDLYVIVTNKKLCQRQFVKITNHALPAVKMISNISLFRNASLKQYRILLRLIFTNAFALTKYFAHMKR